MFRLGDDLLVRLPRRAVAEPLIVHERRWLGELAPGLPLRVPAHVRDGSPGPGYPWAWAIVPWIAGTTWFEAPPDDLATAARRLGTFLAAMHRPAPADAPANPFRGVPLATRAERFVVALAEAGDAVDGERCRRSFAELAAAAAPWAGAPRWLHGDPHPLNLIVHGGELTAVIDFGDLCSGDPASDLSAAWIVLPAAVRGAFREAYAAAAPLDDDTWQRARAWALALGVSYVAGSADHPAVAAIGRRAIAAALDAD
jgi:aminoglycoside phosphotransferase (APT) family kinase protein